MRHGVGRFGGAGEGQPHHRMSRILGIGLDEAEGGLVAEIGTDNPASSAVAERAGYRRLLERPDGTVAYVTRGTERATGVRC